MSSISQSMLNFESHTPMNKFQEKQLNILLQTLLDFPHSFEFQSPVEWKKYGLDNYLKIVKKPMDLVTVRTNIKHEMYQSV